MTLSLADYVDRPILVCAPGPFQDTNAHLYKLVGVEPQGIWLEIPDLAGALLAPEHNRVAGNSLIVLIPFSQISAVVLPEIGRADSTVPPAAEEISANTDAAPATESPLASGQPVAKRKRGK